MAGAERSVGAMRFLPALVALAGLAGGPLEAALLTQLRIADDAPATTNTVSVELWAMNPDSAAATLRPPQTIRLRAANASGGELALSRAETEPGTLTVAPGGFARVRYAGQRSAPSAEWLVLESDPAGEAGTWRIALAPQTPAGAAGADPAATTASASETTNAKVEAGASDDATDKPKRTWTTGLSPNEPMYFSIGWHEGMNARFQISLKYRLLKSTEAQAEDEIEGKDTTPWNDFYVGYTQISVWDLESDSKPFFDTSYKPSACYYRAKIASTPGAWRFGWAGGLEHESNGQGGAASRSMNIAFLRPEFTWGDDQDGWFLRFAPKLYAYLEKSENPDISEYRGYGDYRFVVGRGEGAQLAVTPRLGTSGHGSVLMDFSWPLDRLVSSLNGYLHVQYFDGYGETLRTYDQDDPWQVRIGYMLVR